MIPEYFKVKTKPNEVWAEYGKCKAFNSSIDLYETVKRNERFVSGNQWEGVKAPDIDKITINMLNRTVMYQVAQIVSDNIGVSIAHANDGDTTENQAVARYLEKAIEDVMEDTSFHSKTRTCLRDAAVDGDCCLYAFWDVEKNKPMVETVPNTSVLFGNPSVTTVQDQPYIIIEQSRDIKDVKWQAYADGVTEWENITPDNEEQSRQSDTNYSMNNTVTVLKKFWRDLGTGHIWFTECTKTVTLHDAIDTELTLYPIAWMCWESVKESYHGKAIVTGNIDNQIAINRLWTGIAWHERQNAFPKVFYDKSKIQQWDNMPGAAYGVLGGITDSVATSFQAPSLDRDVIGISDKMISLTRDMMGVNDAVLGNIDPNNTSAIIAVQKSTTVPLELQRLAFYQFVEDIIRVLIDLLIHNLGVREIRLKIAAADPVTGQTFDTGATAIINFDDLTYDDIKLKVDVGASAYWSELTQTQTMDNLFNKQLIDAQTYIEGIPDNLLPHKNAILEKLIQAMNGASQSRVEGTEDVTQDAALSRAENLVNMREEQMDEAMQGV